MEDSHDPCTSPPSESQLNQQTFWQKHLEAITDLKPSDFRTQELPLARIKKIMKLDDDVKMISAEAPVLFSKAAEIFIAELSLRAWLHTEDNKRRTLQRNDIATAITKYDQFDFLIDIVPRDELKPTPKRQDSTSMTADQAQYFLQFAQNQGTMVQIQTPTTQAAGNTQAATQLTQQPQYITVGGTGAGATQLQTVQQTSTTESPSSGTTTQLMTSSGQTIQLPAGASIQQLVSGDVPQLQLNQQGGLQLVQTPQGMTLQANGQQQINAQDLVAQLTGQQGGQQVLQIQQLPIQGQGDQVTQQVFLTGATTEAAVTNAGQ